MAMKKKKDSKKSKPAAKVKKGAPGKVRAKTADKAANGKPAPAAPNPYDIVRNGKRRQNVLGQRSKGEMRNLAKSRGAANKERMAGLLKESLSSGRTSKFKDSRVGGALFAEDLANNATVQRFVKLRQRETRKTFNIGSVPGQELTVGGRPLSSLTEEELKTDGGDRAWEEEADEAAGLEETGDDRVARAKQVKAEMARERKELDDQRSKLDDDFGDIMGELAFKVPKKLAPLSLDKDEPDNYDHLVKRLGMERRAVATDRVKSQEEIVREQAEKLAALERARRARAEGLDAIVSAEAGPDEEGGAKKEAGSDASEEEDDEEGGEEEESEEESAEGAEGSDAEEEGEEEGAEDEDDDDRQGEGCPQLLSVEEANALDITGNEKDEEGLPFAPECPQSRRAVVSLLADKKPVTALKLVQRVRACNAKELGAQNHAKLKGFFLALLEFTWRIMVREDGDLSTKGVALAWALRKPLVDMASSFPDDVAAFFTERLAAMSKAKAPTCLEFCCLKLIAMLFPTTDFQHPVCTPAQILASHWASNIAALGTGITDLISEGTLLWQVLYEFCIPGRRFCSSFFQLGAALLESCWSSVGAGRTLCAEAAEAIAKLLAHSLRELKEEEPVLSRLAAAELIAPVLEKLAKKDTSKGNEQLAAVHKELQTVCKELQGGGLAPLSLFETTRPQIRTLDPIFHEVGDVPLKGMEASETKQLQRRLTKERRSAARKLTRDAVVLQQLQAHKETKIRVKRTAEIKRSRVIMDQERDMLKKMATETDKSMDTSVRKYSRKKQEGLLQKRVGGNETAENKKEAKVKEKAPQPKSGEKMGPKKKQKNRAEPV